MRVFIAVGIPEDIKKKVREIQKRFYKKGLSVSREIHITLRFFGEVNKIQLSDIISRLKEINFKKFEIVINGVGFFGSGGRLRVVFLNIYSKELLELVSNINKSIPDINPRHIKSTPHLTLFRVKSKEIKKEHFAFEFMDKFVVQDFDLIESVQDRGGHKYRVLEKFSLI